MQVICFRGRSWMIYSTWLFLLCLNMLHVSNGMQSFEFGTQQCNHCVFMCFLNAAKNITVVINTARDRVIVSHHAIYLLRISLWNLIYLPQILWNIAFMGVLRSFILLLPKQLDCAHLLNKKKQMFKMFARTIATAFWLELQLGIVNYITAYY